jgi:hypothetical protein
MGAAAGGGILDIGGVSSVFAASSAIILLATLMSLIGGHLAQKANRPLCYPGPVTNLPSHATKRLRGKTLHGFGEALERSTAC